MKMFGLYRLSYGTEIIKSFFDYETNTIGPYMLPIKVHEHSNAYNGNSIAEYRLYELMQNDKDLLAVFNNNNFCFCLVYADRLQMKPFFNKDLESKKYSFKTLYYPQPLKLPTYRHIGYMKTYQDCKAVYCYPWYIVQNVETGEIPGFKDRVSGEPLVDPPLVLYKELLSHREYKGVYYDMDKLAPVFIN